jgi:UDP-N-acetylglucosamine--N-acetylmuramyl-(pentapeptide) pyrophosphoryl-undecaprenol N-acetylglucosamine transferase
MQPPRIIISGGGTGGHIFPAIAIANAVKEKHPNAEILFVGAKGKMEMEKVPAAGYKIVGLTIAGLQRRLTLKNLSFPFKVIKSIWDAKKIVKEFKPDVAIGVGGYASGPLLRTAGSMNVPTLIQEQNSYPGITNKLLAKKAAKICVAYDNMDRFFPKEKIILTGNPVRKDIIELHASKEEALAFFGLKKNKPTILVIGGSLGARTINESILAYIKQYETQDVQVIWQTGKLFIDKAEEATKNSTHIKAQAFITRMDLAYTAADIIISRAGALSISELCLVKKPCILVPSPNVSEDHQTKNAMSLVNKLAAVLVKDNEAISNLGAKSLELINNKVLRDELSNNIAALGKPNAANDICEEVLKLIKNK